MNWTAHNARRAANVAESKALLQEYLNAGRRASTPKWIAKAEQARNTHADFCVAHSIYNPLNQEIYNSRF